MRQQRIACFVPYNYCSVVCCSVTGIYCPFWLSLELRQEEGWVLCHEHWVVKTWQQNIRHIDFGNDCLWQSHIISCSMCIILFCIHASEVTNVSHCSCSHALELLMPNYINFLRYAFPWTLSLCASCRCWLYGCLTITMIENHRQSNTHLVGENTRNFFTMTWLF